MKIFDLTCEYQHEPLGVIKPRFFWKYSQNGLPEDELRPAFTLCVASQRALLDTPDIFKGQCTKSTYAEPQLKLQSLKRYYWQVSCNGEKQQASFVSGICGPWSTPFLTNGGCGGPQEYFRLQRTVGACEGDECMLAICSRGYHRLLINGIPASFGFAPNRSNIEDGYLLYEVYDISRLIRNGDNTIEILCDAGWCRKCGLEPCVAVKGALYSQGGVQSIDSAQEWLCSGTGQWCTGDYAWGNFGGEHLRDVQQIKNQVIAQSIDVEASISWDCIERDSAVECIQAIEAIGAEPCVVDMGRNFTGFVSLRLQGERGQTAVMMVSDKPGELCSFNQRYELEFCGGSGEFINCFNWVSGRYLRISGAEPPEINDIIGFSVSNISRRTGFFSGDEELEAIMRLDADTFIANTISGVTMDCPHRERLGYGETGCSTTWGVGLPLFDSANFYSGYLKTWASRSRKDGYLPHVAPDFWGGGGTLWSGYPLIGLADFYAKYPDERLLSQMRPVILAWLEYLAAECDGLLQRYEPEEWGFLGDWATPEGDDWGCSREALFFNNCCYAYVLKRALELDIADENKTAVLKSRHIELCRAINSEFLREGVYCAPHARYQAAALICGAADGVYEAVYERMLQIIRQKGYLDGGSAGFTLLLRVLGQTWRGREAVLSCLKKREYPGLLHFIDCGQTTLPEMWDMRDIYGGSRIHTCYSGASGFIMRFVAGIEVRNGIVITPHISASIPEYSAYEETLYGKVGVNCFVKDGEVKLVITVPFGCAASLEYNGIHKLFPGENRFCFEAAR